ncbi:ATP-binding cassette sub-family C member 9-like [Dendronephthya gigantea]|uniref:ATP-binding cassette sub-family C member 9-like n=1 Tax=Dendronephthya gigantea TaxID=151771 RepID=UPI00106923F0|nr:ATP-binding cassette sub-family C member 9-like [Dendronephthya gigantea]
MAVTWCSGSGIKVRENGVLTSCFVDTLFLIPTAIVLFVLIPALVLILRGKSEVFGQSCVRFKHHSLRWMLTILLALSYLAKIGEGFMYQQQISTTPLHLYLPNILALVCLIIVTVYYDIVEVSHESPVKKLSIIILYWLSSVIMWAVKFVQLYQAEGPYDIRLSTNLLILLFYILLLIIERRVIFSHLPQRSRGSAWSRANASEMEEDSCRNFQEGKIKFVHDFSNFLSRCTFSWMYDMLKLGNSRPLEPEDLGDLPSVDKADHNHKHFMKVWEAEKVRAAKKQTTPSIWLAFFLTYRKIILTAATCRLIGDLLSFIGPLCLKQIVAYVERTLKSNGEEVKPPNEDNLHMSISDFFSNGFVLSVVILVGNIASSTFIQYYFYNALRYSMNLRASLQVMIYNKGLNLSSFTISGGKMDSGQIVNHISTDTQNIALSMTFLHNIWAAPLKLVLALAFVVNELGVAAFLGFIVLLILIPINYVLAAKMGKFQKIGLGISDERLKNSNEMLQGMKLLKLYAWEGFFCELIEGIRRREISVKLKSALLNGLTSFVTTCTTTIVALVMFVSYVKVSGKELTASKAFASLALINLMKVPLFLVPLLVRTVVNARVSTKRLLPFLLAPEISHLRDEAPVCVVEEGEENPGPEEFKMAPLTKPTKNEPKPSPGSPTIEVSVKFSKDESSKTKENDAKAPSRTDPDFCIPPRIAVVINEASFSWDPEADEPTIANVDVNVPKGKLTMIVGPVGSGKSSLVNALLGEMTPVGGQVLWADDVTVAYAAQKAWLLNDTVKNNILFGQPFIRERYDAILQACALKSDLEILPAGDETEIGEKGINLSGGQKQRISLARAVYSGANFVMFDDPLSALDAHVGQHVFEQAIMNMLVKRGRTVVLVTHQLQYLPKADNVIVMKDGCAVICSTFKEVQNTKLNNVRNALTITRQQSIEREQHVQEEEEPEVVRDRRHTVAEEIKEAEENEQADEKGKLITKEEREKGAVALRVYLSYAKACGYLYVVIALVLAVVAQGGIVGADWWLSIWSSDRPVGNTSADHDVDYYLVGYTGLSIAAVVLTFFKSISIALCCLRGAKLLHVRMLRRIVRAPMRFFDTTPIGRVLNRMSSDTTAIDSNLPMVTQNFINTMLGATAALVVQAAVTPYFLIVVLPFIIIYYYVQRFIRRSTRELQRLDSISKSPIYAQLSETLGGLSTIRAYRSQERFQHQIKKAIDKNNVAFIFTQMSHRWLGLRLDYGGAMIVFLAAVSSVAAALSGTISPGLVGLALTYALAVAQVFNWVVRMATEIEMNMNAVERVDHYSNIDNEPSPKDADIKPGEKWPEKGEIGLRDLTLAYAHELPPAIKDVSVDIKAGEKIGVCGRTGSGKSTVTLGLFRMLEHFEGHIIIDGIDISQMSLRALRSRLAIIPQDPILFQGTVRFNLDPRGVHEDDALWHVLEVAQLKNAIAALSGGLEGVIVEGGENLSVGQRQLFCLARALLVKSRVLVMDEATANVDLETDKLIQEVVRSAFKEFTILTIAHRIDTILDSDRIMVLDQGRLIEWDAPEKLLANKESVFSSLVKAHK